MTTANKNNIINFPAHTAPSALVNPAIANKKANTSSRSRKRSHLLAKPVLPQTSFRLIETANMSLEILMAAKSVSAGLKKGENVILVSPESPEYLIRKLAMIGLNAQPYVDKGQLIIFNSQPAIAGNLSMSTNYKEVFDELFSLAGCSVDRVVMLRMDLLVNLESQYLAYASVCKFTQAAEQMGCKFIAQYSRNHSEAQDRLDAACSSLVNAYFVMKCGDKKNKYQLLAKNIAA